MVKFSNLLNAWMGDIPIGWTKRRLKFLFSIKKEIAGEEGHTVLSITQQGIIPKNMEEKGQFAANYSKYQLVKKGDFAMNHMDLLTGWVDVSEYDGVTSPDYRVFTLNNKEEFDSDYYKYIFQLCYKHRIFYSLGQGVSGFGRWRLPTDMFLNFELPIPSSHSEQYRIGKFLKAQCTMIDSILLEARMSIADYQNLKLSKVHELVTKGLDDKVEKKYSGYADIGYIPSEWNVMRIKDAYTIVCGATPKDETVNWENGTVAWVGPADIPTFGKISKGRRNISQQGYDSCGTTIVPIDSIVISTRAPIGKVCIAENELCTNQGCKTLVKKIKEIDNRYVAYYLYSIVERLQQDGTGVTFKELSTKNLSTEPLLYPEPDIQKQIADLLDAILEKYNVLIKEKEQLCQELEEYKVSLIYDYVTGKRKVV